MFLSPRHIAFLVFGVVLSTMMPAQDLPSFSRADNIRQGTLGSGREYYVVTNKTEEGYADFALVSDREADISSLDSLPHFFSRNPWRTLSGGGAGIGKGGWLRSTGTGSVFHFSDIPTGDKTFKDSTLLMLFDLEIFSMMLPPAADSGEGRVYSWNPSPAPSLTISSAEGLPSVTVSYRAPRTDREYMATALPYISSMYASELGEIVSRRVGRSLESRGIPFASVSSEYLGSSSADGDECWSVTVSTAADGLLEASRTVSAVLSSIKAGGVSAQEYADARASYSSLRVRRGAETLLSNEYYIERCVAAFLRGADLSSPSDVVSYFSKRSIADTTELRLFNNYASALLDRDRNLSLQFSTDSVFFTASNALAEFRYAWDNPRNGGPQLSSGRDSLGLNDHVSKIRIKSEQPDQLSGGVLWTASNGMKVVWRKVNTPGTFRWGYLLKGGYALIPGFKAGEGAFASDMLSLYSVGGLKAEDFANMLSSNGIEISYKVSMTDTRLTGSAPSSKLRLLLKSLVSLSNERIPDEQAFARYLDSERLRLSAGMSLEEEMKERLFPGDIYSSVKRAENLHDDLQERAEAYFEERFSRAGDGILVLAGDLDEQALRRALGRSLGNFRTSAGRLKAPRISSPAIAGSVSYEQPGGTPGIHAIFSLPLSYTGENRMAAYMASMILKRKLSAALVPWGMSVEVRTEASAYPDERFTLFVDCLRAPAGSVPDELLSSDISEALTQFRRTISDAGSSAPPEAVLSSFKKSLVSEISLEMEDAEAIVEAVLIRYADGKDVVTRYKEKINSVSAARVREILSSLSGAPKVECLVR